MGEQIKFDWARSSAGVEAPLTPKQQFWWGCFGGALIPFFQAGMCATAWASGNTKPTFNLPTCIICAVWVALPFASGALTRARNPHDRLHAVIEGITAPAVFILLAQHFHL
jgi:hypothetical protein